MLHRIQKILLNYKFLLLLYVLCAIIASIHLFLLDNTVFDGIITTNYNNYLTMKYSFNHLIDYKDIYISYPYEHWDLFKYSPTFACFMGLFTYFPNVIGLILWSLINAIPLFFAVKTLPLIDNNKTPFILLFILIELLTCLQNSQSNGLVAALFILTFISFENKNYSIAAFCIICSIFIKIFGILLVLLFLLYPNKNKFILYFIIWFIIILSIPLIFISPNQLFFLYQSWFNLLIQDHAITWGMSFMGMISSLIGYSINKDIIIIIAAFIQLLPLVRKQLYNNYDYRIKYFCSIIIWAVVFNYRAESPMFIIPVAGIAIWYVIANKNIYSYILIMFTFLLTVLSPTDLYPEFLRTNIIKPYLLKVLPCFLVWCKIMIELLFFKK